MSLEETGRKYGSMVLHRRENIITARSIYYVLSLISFGICLPSTDVGTDINLGVKLFLNGHPSWRLYLTDASSR